MLPTRVELTLDFLIPQAYSLAGVREQDYTCLDQYGLARVDGAVCSAT
jgi:hypothetical protein